MNNVAKEGLEEALSRQLRSTRERLGAMLGRQGEALSPWVLRRTLRELQNVADPAVSDVEGGRRAAGVAGWYARGGRELRRARARERAREQISAPAPGGSPARG